MSWKILLTDGLEENGKVILRAQADITDQPTITPDELLKTVGEYDAVIVRGRTKVIPAVFDATSKLKVVGRAGVGVDNIDLAAAKAHGVKVVNSPLATTLAVAELTMGLMFSLAREIPRADAAMKNAKWLKKELEGIELNGKTLGVVGFGRIGSAVAQRAAAMGMKILASDPLLKDEEIRSRGGEPVRIDDLYAQSDFITIHTPLTNETRGIINAAAFAKMKNGVRLVCAARGGVIDEAALLDALNSGKVGGAGLDVYATEPPGESALAAHPHVVATPHVAAQTVEAQARAAADIAGEVLAALKGDQLRWRVA
jgi:D-3-phosphoglycerate dehydrogenase / 2-oxoglutarate reductase